jgi:TonB-linked SusC/RagA family outer membrane protein
MKKIKQLFDFKDRLFLYLFLFSTIIYAQQSITGVVIDGETNEPLFGVTVIVDGTTKGVVSDFDGNFTITNMEPGDYKLNLSYAGYASVSGPITVGSSDASINFSMQFSASELNEIVVTGTGAPIAKKQLGNSIGSISTAKLANLPINSVSDILQGREPGIVGLPSGGLTGEGTQIRIRGSASLSQLNEPIVIIDGIRVDRGGGFGGGFVSAGGGGSTSRLDDINPESIERIEILKGASAATLFGTEASNGVIQIFTKRGKTGAPKFDFKTTQGFINFPKGRIADNTGFTTSASTAAVMSTAFGRTIRPYEMVSFNATEDLFEQGLSNTFNMNVSGGTDFITYFTSARYSYTDGPFGAKDRVGYLDGQQTLATDIDELAQFNLNLNINPNDKWSIRLNSGYTSRYSSAPENNNNIYGVGSLAQMSKPELVKPNNSTGTIAFASVDETLQIQTESRVNKYTGSAKINYYPVENVKLDLTFGVDYSSQLSSNLLPFGWNIDGFSSSRPDGALQVDTRNFLAKSSEFKVNINNEFGNFKSSLIVGGQYVGQKTRVLGSQGLQFPGPGFEIVSAAAVQSTFESVVEVINTGAFVQEQLGYKNHLFVTVGGRLDAHSAFGSEFNAAFYPKISMSFVPSDKDGWSNIGPISSLQLRGSYGWAGLQPGAFDAFTTYQALASGTGAGIAPNNLGNPELSPEISKELEFGFNAGLFNDKINVEFTYWDRVTEDALYARQFPLSGGFRSTQLTNIGLLSANGIEFNINGNIIRRQDLTVNLYFNAAYLQEKVEDLGGSPPLKVGGSYPRYRNYLIEGAAPGANYGAKLLDVPAGSLPVDIANSDGLPDTEAQLTAFLSGSGSFSVPSSIGTGSVLLADDDGDGDYLDHFLGKSTPDWTGSFGGSVNYKQWTLSTTFEYKGGNFVVNNLTDAFRQANGAIGRNLPRSANTIRDYMTGGLDSSFNLLNDGAVRVAALDEWVNNTLALAPFSGLNTLEKADFIRWRELSLNYKIQGPILDMLNFETASVGVSGRNLAIFTEFTGVDPELNSFGRGATGGVDQNFGQGISAFGWPIPTQVLFTLKFGF